MRWHNSDKPFIIHQFAKQFEFVTSRFDDDDRRYTQSLHTRLVSRFDIQSKSIMWISESQSHHTVQHSTRRLEIAKMSFQLLSIAFVGNDGGVDKRYYSLFVCCNIHTHQTSQFTLASGDHVCNACNCNSQFSQLNKQPAFDGALPYLHNRINNYKSFAYVRQCEDEENEETKAIAVSFTSNFVQAQMNLHLPELWNCPKHSS